jgi:hypothetical protein
MGNRAYLDIGGNGFVFVLPDNADGKPGERIDPPGESSTTAAAATSSSLETTDQSLEKEHDNSLANIIADIFETKDDKDYQPTTQQLLKSVIQRCRKESLDQDHYTMVRGRGYDLINSEWNGIDFFFLCTLR